MGEIASKQRVCVSCGNPPGSQSFCDHCGRNLTAEPRLPTREEWQDLNAKPPTVRICTNCLSDIPDGQHACTECDASDGSVEVDGNADRHARYLVATAARRTPPVSAAAQRNNRFDVRLGLIGAGIAIVAIVLVLVLSGGGPDASDMEKRLAKDYAATEITCVSSGREEFRCHRVTYWSPGESNAGGLGPGDIKCEGDMLVRPQGTGYRLISEDDGIALCLP